MKIKTNMKQQFVLQELVNNYTIIMREIVFEWDENKNSINKQKHEVAFEEARTVFFDPDALVIFNPDHSDYEERFLIMGYSHRLRLLVVCHCYRGADETIRLISARKANRNEAAQYTSHLN